MLIAIPMTALLVITYCEADGYFKHGGDQKVVKVAYMVSLGMQVFFFVLDFPIGRLNRNDELDVDCFLGKNLLMDGRTIRQAGQHLASRIR